MVYPHITLPYKGRQGDGIIKKFRSILGKHIPDNIKPRFTYKGTKISKFFSPKDKIQEDHQSNLTYAYTRNREIRETGTKAYISEGSKPYISAR